MNNLLISQSEPIICRNSRSYYEKNKWDLSLHPDFLLLTDKQKAYVRGNMITFPTSGNICINKELKLFFHNLSPSLSNVKLKTTV